MKFYINILVTCVLFAVANSFGGIRPKLTARLLGNGGAGVGSILAPEALFLNPASITFYKESHLYFNQSEFSWDETKTSINRRDKKSQDFIITDGSNGTKGGMAYNTQYEKDVERKTYSMAIGTSAGKDTAIGFLVKRHEETSNKENDVFNQLTIGFSHVMSPGVTVGLIVQDIGQGNEDETRLIIGSQFTLSNRLAFIGDVGTYYLGDFYKDTFYNIAMQVSVLEKFYLRAGYFQNDFLAIRGHGWGANWVGPKLSLDFGVRFTEGVEDGYFLNDEQSKEIAFAFDIRF